MDWERKKAEAMGSLTSLTDPAAIVVADASAVINLNASGSAHEILRALPNRVVVADAVLEELEQGRVRDRRDAELLRELLSQDAIELVTLGEAALERFEELVVGPAAETLDDGEAATIAYAIARGGMPLVDERKANRLCAERFPRLRRGCTVDIFAHPEVGRRIGNENLAEAVFKALYHGRMRVLPHHLEWVVSLIGRERAALCRSLPAAARFTRSA